MKKALVLFSYCAIFISACSTENNNKSSIDTFVVTAPLLTDTVRTKEYVADLHSFQNVEIRNRVRGYIEAIHVDEGKMVTVGQKLFSISNKRFVEGLAKAKAHLKNASAQAKLVELAFEDTKLLVNKEVVSSSQLEVGKAKLDAANASVEEAKAAEATAALNLSFTEVKAPFDGILNRIPYKVGSLVDEGTLLTTLSNNKDVYAYFSVSEKEYLDMIYSKENKQNDEVEMILANNKLYPYKGKIETVEGEVDKATGNISFRARFHNPDQILKHGSSGKILIKRKIDNSLLISQKSTIEVQDKIFVFVVNKNNVVEMKSVKIKYRMPKFYIVESGLTPNDKIIYEGVQYLKNGDKIIPEEKNLKELLSK